MRSLFLALLSLAVLPYARAQYTTLTASEIQDVTGAALGSGYLCLTPVNASGVATPFTIGGGKGQVVPSQKCYAIYQGGITSAPVPDTSLTVPAIGYQVTILDAFNHLIVQYSQPIKPTGPTFNFDTWQPSVTASVSPAGAFIFFGAAVPTTGCTAPSFGYTTAGALYSCLSGVWSPVSTSGGGSGSARVVYASRLLGTTGDAAVAAGSSAASTTDRAPALNAALAGGNIRLVVDGQYGLGASLVLSSNTDVTCLPGQGFIMRPASNVPMFVNAHANAATTSNGLGGYLPSNIVDSYIGVHGCELNFNSTEAVTGNDPLFHLPHHVSAITGKWVLGFQLLGVDHLDVSDNDLFDSGAYAFAVSNVTHLKFFRNVVHQPLPTVAFKNTDAFHIVGPAQYVDLGDNHLNGGDDSIALNADDGNVPVGADPNAVYGTWAGWQNGNITDVHIHDTTLDHALSGVRFYTGTSLIDRVYVENTSGTTMTGSMFLSNNAAMGAGNIGHVYVNGWDVQPDGTNTEGISDVIGVTSHVAALDVSGLHYASPLINWPILEVEGSVDVLRLSGWDVDTRSGSFGMGVKTTGSVGRLSLSGLNWLDASSDAAGFIGGGTVPSAVTVSNYAGPGPNRLLVSGYAPAIQNGDAFTNVYSAAVNYGTVYVNTSFNEGAAGASLQGTVPAICANGCAGTWTTSTNAGSPTSSWQYASGGGIVQSYAIPTAGTNVDSVINAGVSNYVVRANITSTSGAHSVQFFVRYTDNSDYVVVDMSYASMSIYDATAGVATQVATVAGNFATPGPLTITVNGTTITATALGQTISGSLPSGSVNTSSGKVGPNQYAESGMTLSSLIVSSQ